ncbi:MAG TPA: NADH-quinone oxidoreductase subunit L [Trueperaceae bacterium]|nr:NADH-quinone oxidoreductase subunit L [Trueperaceae bacterium]
MSDSTLNLVQLVAYAPLLALLGAVVNGLFGRSLKEPLPGIIASALVGSGFVLGVIALIAYPADAEGVRYTFGRFLQAGDLSVDLGFMIDQLSLVMTMVITGIGLLIHIYSIGYMRGDEGYARFFAQLNLFVAAMLVLVLADSFPLMFVGWEGVGVCSFLLIGFWYGQKENADAGRKAFIVNRIGDVGFLIGMFLTYQVFGSLDIQTVTQAAPAMLYGSAALTGIGLLYLLAAAGKSAQLPLQLWLPDAMAGPTPVSALIHAATMVTAGVYLIARTGAIYAQAPDAAATVAWIGVLTALVAAFSAFAQTDIKRILAYSTISQVGFMIAAVGAGAYWVGIFHVVTHAFFKALLFLGSGSVIHALGGEQDVRRMGGLGKRMKVTGTTSLIATLAIAGVPLLAGFFSKDAILSHTLTSPLLADSGSAVLYGLLLLSAVMTAFYMFRWYYLVFAGEERFEVAKRDNVHEAPAIMTAPLVVLAVGSVFAGYLGIQPFLARNVIAEWLAPVTAAVDFEHLSLTSEWLLIAASGVAAAAGLGLGYWVYAVNKGRLAKRLEPSPLTGLSRSGFGFDAASRAVLVHPGESVAEGLSVLDRDVLDRGMSGSAGAVGLLGRLATAVQSGYVRLYALTMLLGAALLGVLVAVLEVAR